MSTYPNLNNDTEWLKTKQKDDKIKDLKYKTEKHDHENTLKSLKTDNEYYKKKYKSSSKKKHIIFITEIFVGSALTVTSNK